MSAKLSDLWATPAMRKRTFTGMLVQICTQWTGEYPKLMWDDGDDDDRDCRHQRFRLLPALLICRIGL